MKEINIKIDTGINTDINIIINNINNFTIECKNNFDNININYDITSNMNKIKNIINAYPHINKYNVTFSKLISKKYIDVIITKLHNILYCYYPNNNYIILNNVSKESQKLFDELTKNKDIIMDPNKTPDTYLKYVLSRLPKQYKADVFKIKKTSTKMFPLTQCVSMGSQYNAYFVHIKPKHVKPNGMNIYLVGKAVTYDSGGMNLKIKDMENMKIDMTGSSIILSVLNLLKDTSHNIHLLIPIVENMIGNTAIKPGMVIKSMGGKMVEITDTDAEGRLCIADAIEYIILYLIKEVKNNLVIDIATLTGNASHITNNISSLITGNEASIKYINTIIKIGDEIGEYVDYLKLRKEYLDYLKSNVADVVNINKDVKSDCIMGGVFINYFMNDLIPFIHIDLGESTFVDNIATSYGINLLYTFISSL
jgi:leucyl aminopeptidase